MDMREIVIILILVLCFIGAALSAWELTVFLLTFRYRELTHPDPSWRRASIIGFVITLAFGLFPTLALMFVAVNIHRLFG